MKPPRRKKKHELIDQEVQVSIEQQDCATLTEVSATAGQSSSDTQTQLPATADRNQQVPDLDIVAAHSRGIATEPITDSREVITVDRVIQTEPPKKEKIEQNVGVLNADLSYFATETDGNR